MVHGKVPTPCKSFDLNPNLIKKFDSTAPLEASKIALKAPIALQAPWGGEGGSFRRYGFITKWSLQKKCQNLAFFRSVFSHIRTEYGDLLCNCRYKSECGKIWTRKTPNSDTYQAVGVKNI